MRVATTRRCPGTSPYITTYNKEVFKRAGLDENKPPATMDELFDAGSQGRGDGQGDYGIYGSPEWYMVAQLHGRGVTLLNEDKTAFNFADNEAAINYVTSFRPLRCRCHSEGLPDR